MDNLARAATDSSDAEVMQHYLREILLSPVYQAAVETPLDEMHKLSARLGQQVLLKREDKQPVYSFKLRGAFHKLHKVQQQQPDAKVICASAGNHAQGVALSASKLGLNATIVMPITTPEIKVAAVKALGGNVVLHGTAFDEANSYAINLANTEGAVYIPPFDDSDVIAGQGTVAKELLSQHNQLNAVFIPVGGGGLMAGMAVYIKAIQPNVKVIGVEPEDAACLKAALDAGAPVTLERVGLFADGVAVKRIGTENFNLARRFCDEVVTVSSDRIDFKKPIPAGTIIELVGKVSYIGNTSIKVRVDIYIEEMYEDKRYMAVGGDFTFVAIDENKKPVKIVA